MSDFVVWRTAVLASTVTCSFNPPSWMRASARVTVPMATLTPFCV